MIKQIIKYNQLVWQDEEADNLRAKQCMCWKCSKLKPEQEDNCKIAQQLFDMCKSEGLATMITRCKNFNNKESQDV